MLTHLLLKNQGRLFWRSTWRKHHWLLVLFVGLVGLSMAFLLAQLGYFFKEILYVVRPEHEAVPFLNEHLVTLFVSLFIIRFFVQQTPRMRIRPYLHLPISRVRLVLFFQLTSLASIHNVYPFFFLLPFWVRHLADSPFGPRAAWAWLMGIVLLILLSHYANNLLRSLLSRSRQGFFLVLGVLILLITLDLLFGSVVLGHLSLFIFGTLIAERPWMLGLLALFVGVIFAYSSLLLYARLLDDAGPARHDVAPAWRIPFAPSLGTVLNLILLEGKLIWRCERPKLYFLYSVVFGTLYVAAPLISADLYGSTFIQAFVGIFATGIFALNYGQLMFSWESSYFDGLLTRHLPLRHLVYAKILLLQGSCVFFYLLTLPLFAVLAPELLPLHAAFLLYNLGVTSMLVMTLAVGNHKRITLADVGFFNFEGFSVVHWLWFIPAVVPPALLLYIFREQPPVALLLLGGLGLASAACTGPWSTFFAHRLAAQRYMIAQGFRQNAG